jgi:hypothetical protein
MDSAGISLHAIQADFPWRYYRDRPIDPVAATVDWRQRLHGLERYARAKEVRYHLTVNSESGYNSAREFAEDSLAYLDAYLAAGGAPDAVLVQSWYPHPKELLPETKPYTQAWLAIQFLNRFEALGEGAQPVAAPPLVERDLDRSEAKALCHLLEHLDAERHADAIGLAKRDWLEQAKDPAVEEAAALLLSLRETASSALVDDPHVGVVLGDGDRAWLARTGQRQLQRAGPRRCRVELINSGSDTRRVTAWVEGAGLGVMKPVWIPSGSSRWVLVDLPLFKDDERTVVLQVGEPDTASGIARVYIPISDADGPAGNAPAPSDETRVVDCRPEP